MCHTTSESGWKNISAYALLFLGPPAVGEGSNHDMRRFKYAYGEALMETERNESSC